VSGEVAGCAPRVRAYYTRSLMLCDSAQFTRHANSGNGYYEVLRDGARLLRRAVRRPAYAPAQCACFKMPVFIQHACHDTAKRAAEAKHMRAARQRCRSDALFTAPARRAALPRIDAVRLEWR